MYIYLYKYISSFQRISCLLNILNPAFILVMLLTVLARLVQGESRKQVLERVARPFYPFVYMLLC